MMRAYHTERQADIMHKKTFIITLKTDLVPIDTTQLVLDYVLSPYTTCAAKFERPTVNSK